MKFLILGLLVLGGCGPSTNPNERCKYTIQTNYATPDNSKTAIMYKNTASLSETLSYIKEMQTENLVGLAVTQDFGMCAWIAK